MTENNGVKTYIKGIGFCATNGSNTSEIDVKDGKILRIRPLYYDKEYDTSALNPWKMQKGDHVFLPSEKTTISPFAMVYKKRAYSNNRIPYPLKREDWDPNGERNPQNRGKSKFVRISWDEAFKIVASEYKRVLEQYGPYSVLAQVDGHGEGSIIHACHGCCTRIFLFHGGYTYQCRQADSWEGWYWGAKHAWGQQPLGQGDQNNLIYDIVQNSEMLLCWGCDQETTTWAWEGQQASRISFFLSEIGVKQVYICPDLNYAAAVHADRWIPVLPNTDAAMQLAIVYTWLTEDSYDRAYVETHADGYDQFFDYVLGNEDGIPKTPKWAEPLCGVPSRVIKALARAWAKMRTSTAHVEGGSYIRSLYSHEPARLEVILLTMQGLGKPGQNQLKFTDWQMYGYPNTMPMPRPAFLPTPAAAYQGLPKKGRANVPASFIPKTLMPQALTGGWTAENPMRWPSYPDPMAVSELQFEWFQYPVEGAEPIHMIWSDAPCWTTCWNGGNRMIEAYRDPSIEFIVTQHPWFENDCRFADILLPVSTKFEVEDLQVDGLNGDWNLFCYEGKCIDSPVESLSDYEICLGVAKEISQECFEALGGDKSIDEWLRIGFEHSDVEYFMDYEDWKEKQYYLVPGSVGWEDEPAGFANFCAEPEKYPLRTDTGRVKFYSDELAKHFPDDEERPPMPKWVEKGVTHPGERLTTERAKQYPYLIVSNHPKWRCHAQLDDVTWLREIPTCKVKGSDGYLYEPLWINPKDAEKEGIKSGDVVKIFNSRGWVLGGAYVTERICEHTVYQDHGARLDTIIDAESDRGGANNLIAPGGTSSKNALGEVTSGYLVGIQKVDPAELAAEYPDAFGRTFDTTGVKIENWLA